MISVVATASSENVVPRRLGPIWSFLSARRMLTVLAVTVVIGAFTSWLGTYQAALPSVVEREQPTIPLWRLFAVAVAVMPVVALHGQLADLEVIATRRLRCCQRIYLGGMGLGCTVVYLGLSSITLSPSTLLVIARSSLAWYGLALIAGVLLGWRLAWTLPMMVACILWYWGYQGDSQQYRWWEFSARPYHDLPSLLLSVVLLIVGLGTYWATPWRRRWLFFWLRHR